MENKRLTELAELCAVVVLAAVVVVAAGFEDVVLVLVAAGFDDVVFDVVAAGAVDAAGAVVDGFVSAGAAETCAGCTVCCGASVYAVALLDDGVMFTLSVTAVCARPADEVLLSVEEGAVCAAGAVFCAVESDGVFDAAGAVESRLFRLTGACACPFPVDEKSIFVMPF